MANFGEKNGMFGKKHTPEAIEKMRQASLGKKKSPATLAKLSESLKGRVSGNKGKKWTEEHRKLASAANSGTNNPRYGKKMSEETKQKIREKALGRKMSAEARSKISAKSKINSAGEKHWNWKGGITAVERKERKRFSEEISPQVFARDNYTCQTCDEYGGILHADHIKGWSEAPELRFELDNCRTLCRPCHYYVTFKKKMPSGSKWGSSITKERVQ